MTESLTDHLEEMNKGFLRELLDAFPIVTEEYSGEAQEVVRATSPAACILKTRWQLTIPSNLPN